jgi:branched-subunit amino acid aminotransferase/4-amino-4-deoxychorismate lyase
MLIPADDRIAVRGHGCFDVIYVKHKSIINLDSHVDRLFNSAKMI